MHSFAPYLLLVALALPLDVQADMAMPPRSASDLVAMLQAKPPHNRELGGARQLLSEDIPQGISIRASIDAHLKRARAAELLGLTDRYLAEYRAAWAASGYSLDPADGQLRVEYIAAEAHSGNLMAAIAVNEEAARRAPLPGMRLAAHAFLAENKARHGDLDGARQHLQHAETEFSLLRRSTTWTTWGYAWESNVERARAGYALGQGKFAEAENHFRRSAALREKDLPENQSRLDRGLDTLTQKIALGFALMAHKGIADMLLQQGRLVEAEVAYRDIIARSSREYGNASPLMLVYLEGLMSVLLEQGRNEDTLALAEATLRILESAGVAPESRKVTATRQRLAAAHVALSQWPQAFQQYEAIRKTLDSDTELKKRLGKGDKSWALTLIRIGQPAAAVAMMEDLLAFDKQRFVEGDRILAETHAFLGMALAETGRLDAALDEFRHAVPTLLRTQQDAGDEGATGEARRLVIVFEAYLDLLWRLKQENRSPPELDVSAEAFRVADAARSSTVQRALLASATRAAIRDPQLAALARQEQDLSRRISTLNDTLSRLLSSAAEIRLNQIIGAIQRDIPRLKYEREQLRNRISQGFPEYVDLIAPRQLSPTEIQALLAPGETMLAIYVGERHIYLWSIPQNDTVRFTISPLATGTLSHYVRRVRSSVDLDEVTGNVAAFDLTAAHELYEGLIAPVASSLATTRHLLVVPHGPAGQIPFALLPTRASQLEKTHLPFAAYRNVPWLLKDFSITQLPSSSTLAALRRLTPAAEFNRLPFLGFGDPWFNERQVESTSSPTKQLRLAGRSINLRASVTTRGSASADISKLQPLPDTANEIRDIAAALNADAADAIRLGKAASETAVVSSQLSNYRIVTFATHGLIPGDLDGLSQPALALSNPALTEESGVDGLLTMEEILGLKLNADWVVLSACNTASGDGTSAEAVSGLGRAFFYAGTRALLVTNWPVETVSARLLTTNLFRRQAEQPELSRAEALRQAMLAIMASDARNERSGIPEFSYAHPLFWAPFVLIGDGGQ